MTDEKKVSKEDFDSEEEFYEKFPGAFRKGQSGNPAGRPKETVNRKTVRQIAEELDFCPIRTAIEMIKLPQNEAREKFNLDAPVSTSQKTKLNMWIGDKMHSSLRAVDHSILDPQDGEDAGILQIVLPAKSSQQKEIPNTVSVPVEAAEKICKAQDPAEFVEED